MARDERQFELSRYLDGDLCDPERAQVEQRVAADEEAGGALAAFRRVDQLVRGAAAPMPAVDWGRFRLGVLERIERPARRAAVWRAAFWTGGLAAAAAAVLIAVLAFMHQDPSTGTPLPQPPILVNAPQVPGITIETGHVPTARRPLVAAAGQILIDVPSMERGGSAWPTSPAEAEGGLIIAMVRPRVVGAAAGEGIGGDWDSMMPGTGF